MYFIKLITILFIILISKDIFAQSYKYNQSDGLTILGTCSMFMLAYYDHDSQSGKILGEAGEYSTKLNHTLINGMIKETTYDYYMTNGKKHTFKAVCYVSPIELSTASNYKSAYKYNSYLLRYASYIDGVQQDQISGEMHNNMKAFHAIWDKLTSKQKINLNIKWQKDTFGKTFHK